MRPIWHIICLGERLKETRQQLGELGFIETAVVGGFDPNSKVNVFGTAPWEQEEADQARDLEGVCSIEQIT